MQVTVDVDIKNAIRKLRGAQRHQIPFAVAGALTSTAWDVQKEETRQIPIKIDRPTPFTLRAFGVQRATKSRWQSRVFAKPIQNQYLRYQVNGGMRLPRNRAIPVPFNMRTNQFGNMPRGKIRKLREKPNTFSGEVKGVSGIWERGHHSKTGRWSTAGKSRSTSIRLLVAYEPRAQYRQRFPFYRIAQGKGRAVFPRNMRRALDRALRSAK